MKKIIVLMLTMVIIVATQAQEKRVQEPRKAYRERMDEKIKLSDEQKQKAKTLNEDYRKKMDDLRKKDDILVKDWRNQMMELNKKHREGMSALLSKEQKEQIGKMKVIRENRSQDMMKKRVEMKELIQKRNENMRSILNDEQMKKMQEMRKSMPRKRRVLS